MAGGADHKRLYCGVVVLLLGMVIVLVLLGSSSRQGTGEFYYATSKEEMSKQALLIAELQSLSQIVNKTVEENAQEVIDQQEALKGAFCNAGKFISFHLLH